MRIFLLLTSLFFAVFTGNCLAESVAVGARGGIDFATLNTIGGVNLGDNTIYGYDAGIFADFKINDFLSLQPEVSLVLKGGQYYQATSSANTHPLTYLEFPLLLKTKVFSVENFSFNTFAGPYVAILLNDISNQYAYSSILGGNINGKYYPTDSGLVLGGTIEYDDLILDVRYEAGLSSVFEGGLNTGLIVDGGLNKVVEISAGYNIIKF